MGPRLSVGVSGLWFGPQDVVSAGLVDAGLPSARVVAAAPRTSVWCLFARRRAAQRLIDRLRPF